MIRHFSIVIALLTISSFLFGQERMISYQAEDKDLSQVFKDLEKTYDLHFAYAVQEIKGKKVSIDVKDQTLSSFLTSLLTDEKLAFEIVEGDFVSVTRSNSILVRMSVKDHESDEELSFATARIKGTETGYIADVKGNFEMVVQDPETILEISFLGYDVKEVIVADIELGKSLEIKLDRSVKELDEIVVKEYLNKGITIDDQSSRISINVQDMEILPGLSERDILLSAQILAGIGSADESAGGLNVRGSSRDNTFIYWNKIPVYQSAHYFGNISSFIPSSVGKVEIFKNYIPVSYGGSSSGLLLINSRMPKTDKVIVESNLNMTHGDIYASVPFANYSGRVSVAARRSFNDVFETPTFTSISDKLFEGSLTEDQQGISDEFSYNSQLVFDDFNATIDWTPSGKNEFSVSILNSRSKLNYNSVDEDDFLQSIQGHNVSTYGGNASWTRRWIDPLSSEVSVSYGDYHMDYSLVNIRNEDDGTEDDLQRRANDLTNLESRFTLTFSPVKDHVFNGGYQFNRVKADLIINESFFFEEDFSETISTRGNTHGLFASYFGKFNSGFQIGVATRYNRYQALDEFRFDRQIRLNYEVAPGLLLKSSVGVYHQYISSLKEVDFVFSNTIEQNWITADKEEEIPVINNEQYVLGALYTQGGWVIDVDGYIKRVFSPVARNFGPRPDDDDGVISGLEKITGLDFTLKRRWKYYRAWASYSFQDSDVEAVDLNFTSGLNIRHQLQLSQTLNYKQFEFSLGYTIRSGLPYTEPTDLEFITGEDEDPFYEIVYESINNRRLPTYKRLDFSLWYKFKSKKKFKLNGEIGISILNVLNENNLYSRTFSVEDDDAQPFILGSERALIGITPNLSLKLKW